MYEARVHIFSSNIAPRLTSRTAPSRVGPALKFVNKIRGLENKFKYYFLLLSRKLRYFRGSCFSQCVILSKSSYLWSCYSYYKLTIVSCYMMRVWTVRARCLTRQHPVDSVKTTAGLGGNAARTNKHSGFIFSQTLGQWRLSGLARPSWQVKHVTTSWFYDDIAHDDPWIVNGRVELSPVAWKPFPSISTPHTDRSLVPESIGDSSDAVYDALH